MNFLFRVLISMLFIVTTVTNGYSKESYDDIQSILKIGYKMPVVQFNDVEYNNTKTVKPSDYKGKWLILDFWHEYCSSCISSMPHNQFLQDKFSGSVQFLLVGMIIKKKATIQTLYEKIREKNNLSIPIAYDSIVHKKLGISAAPILVIINPSGIVVGITYSLNEEQLSAFIAGQSPQLARSYLAYDSLSDKRLGHSELISESIKNGSCLFSSVLSTYNPKFKSNAYLITEDRVIAFKKDLKSLYRIAYTGHTDWYFGDSLYGKINLDPILLVRDSSKFLTSEITDDNLFNYSLVYPKGIARQNNDGHYSLSPEIMEAVQKDLKTVFGYDVRIERRECRCVKLVKNGNFNSKSYSNSSIPSLQEPFGPNQGIKATAISPSELLGLLITQPGRPSSLNGVIFEDETGIFKRIDITIHGIYYDEWISELKKFGFELIPCKKIIDYIVIRDMN
ncbi:Thiol-disulfide isomerase or thioredoxin [Chitinophaga rupis]|uniref:Thiol-disulfide isomerase or thioredoxin n=1 Tax=Chitinophaga rupis TaxID=573321 RepID=A0A1H8IU39_9BACT|nr:TlpA disulfide reductase family protein [Chitinophaga rupis]SEN72143.1 Thiol-disulfide isomerase or thioredoxin [Chitinophaga rupis]